MTGQILFSLSIAIGGLLFGFGYRQMRHGRARSDTYVGLAKILLGIVLVAVTLIAYGVAVSIAATPRDSFIRSVEAFFQVVPGDAKPFMPCQCSIKYLGTERHGNVYDVRLEKLD